MFSPYYAWARGAKGVADPENFCTLNVALYRTHAPPLSGRWTMTERGARHCHREAHRYTIGPSQLRWDGQALHIAIDEITVPIPRRVKGTVRIEPQGLFNFSTPLDAMGHHRWGPLAPRARVEVNLQHPAQRWSGSGYLDSNEGDEPIDRPFREWDWSRTQLADGSVAVLYDVQHKSGPDTLLALRFCPDGRVEHFDAPPRQTLPLTAWRVARRMRSEGPVQVSEQLEDTPFYQRAVLRSTLLGESVTSFHETLDCTRLVSPVVQAMLPWRMPRRG